MSATATAPETATRAQPPPDRRRWMVLAIVLVAEVMDLIDGTIVNVAAPSIRRDLGGSATTLQWYGAAYTLAFAVLLITGARLGDRFDRRKMFLVGVVGFTAASVACAAAPSSGFLITMRAIQGAFGALLIPQGFGMIKAVFRNEEVQKAFPAFGPVIGIAAVISPILGGAPTSGDLFGLGWRAVFLVNLPLGTIGLIGSMRVLPRGTGIPGTRLDPGGAVIATVSAFALVYPLVQGRELGWPAWVFVLFVGGVLGFAAFALYERRDAEQALIAPSLLRNRTYTSGLFVALCFFASMIGLNVVLSLFCQLGEGFSPIRTGLTLAPFALGVAFTAGPSYPLAQKFGRVSMQVGFGVMGAGLVLLALMVHNGGEQTSVWSLVPGELLAGAGMGLALPPLFDSILAGVKDHEVGSASGVLGAVQQFAAAFGIAVFATVFFAYLDAHRPPVIAITWTTLLTLIPLGLACLGVFRLPQRPRENPVPG